MTTLDSTLNVALLIKKGLYDVESLSIGIREPLFVSQNNYALEKSNSPTYQF